MRHVRRDTEVSMPMIKIAASSILACGLMLAQAAQAMDSMEKPMHRAKNHMTKNHMAKPMAHKDTMMKGDMKGDAMKGDAMPK
jgi:pentapeptide MXKDX repeat protein